ncbi:hypothetical protein ABZ250_41165 [Streptomyces afghaniensis]|uniref:hypothetical protein n=1 Tax=Streptomyces afghaniensis TaxID=66865 RepID=UPI0033B54595
MEDRPVPRPRPRHPAARLRAGGGPGEVQPPRPGRRARARPRLRAFGVSIVPYAPLHGGLLADLGVLDREVSGDQRFGAAGFTEAEVAIARGVDRLARQWGLPMNEDPEALVSGRYWFHQTEEPHPAVRDERFQDELVAALAEHTGIELPRD